MARRVILYGSLALMLAYSFVYGQDWLDDGGGKALNHDYFVAHEYPQLKHLLFLAERNHMINCPHDPGGTIADIRNGKFEYAIGDMKYVLSIFVNHPKALQLMAALARLTNKRTLALPYFEKAVRLYPAYAFTSAQYGAYLADIGQLEGGIERLEDAIRLDPKLTAAHVWLSRAYQKRGNLDRAREALRQARELGYQGNLAEESMDAK